MALITVNGIEIFAVDNGTNLLFELRRQGKVLGRRWTRGSAVELAKSIGSK